jgi:hypothetical protein
MQPLEFGELQAILATLSKILARGLAPEQRQAVLRGLSTEVDISKTRDEFGYFQLLLDVYQLNKDLGFVLELADRIQATQSFYQSVGAELDQLQYLIKKNKLEVRNSQQSPYVFVIIPFREEFFATYERAIRPGLEQLGCTVELSKDVNTVDSIVEVIFTQINKADFLIADTTGRNANVFYELGYAHALGKKVVLITQNTADIPFDVAGLRHIYYDPKSLNALSLDLKKVARFLLEQNLK